MNQEKYSLSWETYTDHLKSMMKELMMNEDFSDVTLVTEDKKHIKANVNILSACSPVFNDILKIEKNSKPIVYLRGIQFSEMESIMQFIYLGEATFYKERMDEFLTVAKSLEIKQLCISDETNDETSLSDPEISTGNFEEHSFVSEHFTEQVPQVKSSDIVGINGKFECEPCQKTFATKPGLYLHKQSVHQGAKFACDQCDLQTPHRNVLDRHIKSKHESFKYSCNQCDYQSTRKNKLTIHIQSRHEGVKYACNQCDYQATRKDNLTIHIQSTHEGVKYACDQCDSRFTQQSNLRHHIKNHH